MFEIIKSGTQIDFVAKRHIWITMSVLAILGTIALYFTKGLNYGIDFTGGAEVHVKVPADWDIGRVRKTLEDGGVKDARIVTSGAPASGEFLVRVQGQDGELNKVSAQVEGALTKQIQPGQYEIQKVDVVGPAAGRSLRLSGFLSMFYALLCVVIYVAVRFDVRYTPGVILCVFHDTMIILGVFLVTQKQFDLQILAAILALIGYSNNDTIVTYDRVREVTQMHPELKVEQAVNRAVNETLGRTFLTAFSTFLSVFALWIFGGTVIQDFAFTLMVGLVIGTYSSIFIAGSAVITYTNWQAKRASFAVTGGGGGSKKFQPSRPQPKFQA
jgi:preprotein translocase subunit SecF